MKKKENIKMSKFNFPEWLKFNKFYLNNHIIIILFILYTTEIYITYFIKEEMLLYLPLVTLLVVILAMILGQYLGQYLQEIENHK